MLSYPSIDPIIWSYGPIAIRWYGLAYIAGLVLPFFIFRKTFRVLLNFTFDDCLNFISYLALGVIIGGRFGYVLFYNFDQFLADPFMLIAIWEGGMSYHGGILGSAVGTILFAKHNKRPISPLLDIVALGSTIGIGLGRCANFINGELYGRVTTSPLGMVFPGAGFLPRHPSQLYEAATEGLLIFIILWAVRKWYKPPHLCIGGLYLILYGVFRFIVEFFREPDAHLGFIFMSLSLGQLLCVIEILIGCIVLKRVFRR